MTHSGTVPGSATRRLAWDGFSFETPADWNLSSYEFERGMGRLALEDDTGPRLEMDWLRGARPVQESRLQKKRTELDRAMRAQGAEIEPLDSLPESWQATLFMMPDGRRLLLAYHHRAEEPFFCFLKLFWDETSRRVPRRTFRTLAETFTLHRDALAPWTFYDVSFRLDRRCRLVHTSLRAGSKLMVFTWRRRRLFLWFASLASLALREQRLEAWGAGLLNGFKPLRYTRFVAAGPGRIEARRKKMHVLGHSEEISRWCFRYQVRCRHLPESDRLWLSVFQHRHPRDPDELRIELPDR